jgi:transcriptional regulator with XRE-family HTH domain
MKEHNIETLYQSIGRAIVAKRKSLKWTQAELAEQVAITRTSIVNIEKGRQRLPLHVLYTIALRMNVNPLDLLPSVDEIINGKTETSLPLSVQDFLKQQEK